MQQRIKFGIVGCGRVSPKHLSALSIELDDTELIAVCDTQIDRARAAGEKYAVPAYGALEEMLERHSEIDVVNILTPSGFHAEHTETVARYRRNVVVEKPMALTIDDAERMIRACDEAGVRLFVVKQNRFNLPVQRLRSALEEGRFGKLVMGTVRVRWRRDQAYYDQDAWRGTWALDGGVIANQASHHIDLLTWMMGEVESVFSYTSTRLVDIEADDTAVSVLRFTNGALGVIEATTATRPKDLEGSLSVLGERGTVEIGGFAVNELRVWEFADQRSEDEEVINKFAENPPNVYGFGHARFLQRVVDVLRTGRGGAVDGLEGLKSLTLISAMYESMETGAEVRLRFRPQLARLGVSSG